MKIDGQQFQVIKLNTPLPEVKHLPVEEAWNVAAIAANIHRYNIASFILSINHRTFIYCAVKAVGVERFLSSKDRHNVYAEFFAHYRMLVADSHRGTL